MFSSSHSITGIRFVDTGFGTGDHGMIGEHRRYGGVGRVRVRGWKGDNSPIRVSSVCTNWAEGGRRLGWVILGWIMYGWGDYGCSGGRD